VTQNTSNPSGANAHLEAFLQWYCDQDCPGYAVLLKGEWGCGKTWLVRHLIDKNVIPNSLYISLYGVSQKADIDNSLFAACFPSLASPTAQLGFGFVRMLASRIRIDWTPQISSTQGVGSGQERILQEMLTRANINNRTIIFDDIERCSLGHSEILGICNMLIQEDGCKVILLADEKILESTPAHSSSPNGLHYANQKEKVIEFTFTVQPEVELALDSFRNTLPPELNARHVLDRVKEVHHASGCKNLRHLRATLSGFSRLYKCLPQEAKSKDDVVNGMLTIYAICRHEVQSASISVDDVGNLLNLFSVDRWHIPSLAPDRRDDVAKAAEKYYQLNISGTVVSPDWWISLFKDGSIDEDLLRGELARHGRLGDSKPSWLELLEFWNLGDDDFKKQLSRLLDDIESGSLLRTGEILHASGLLLLFHEMELYDEDPDAIGKKFTKMIRDITSNGREVEPMSSAFIPYRRAEDSYAGYIFPKIKSYAFQEIRELVEDAGNQAMIAQFRKTAEDCIQRLEGGDCEYLLNFFRSNKVDVTTERGDCREVYIINVFTYFDARRLAESLVGLKPITARAILLAVSKLFDLNQKFLQASSAEAEWLHQFKTELENVALSDTKSLERILLKSSVDRFLLPLLDRIREEPLEDHSAQATID
jgi:hypothetical protein